MSRRYLSATSLFLGAVLAGASYAAAERIELAPAATIAWKGAGVGLLAACAAVQARNTDGWLLAAVMGLGALGDVLLETAGLKIGAVAFLAGHVAAIALYLRNRREAVAPAERWAAYAFIPVTTAAAFLLPAERSLGVAAALYALALAAMAAFAWLSRFPRDRVALGALMFVASDLLIFAREGPLAGAAWADPTVWYLYFFGQTWIFLGVTAALVGSKPRHRHS